MNLTPESFPQSWDQETGEEHDLNVDLRSDELEDDDGLTGIDKIYHESDEMKNAVENDESGGDHHGSGEVRCVAGEGGPDHLDYGSVEW